MSYIFYPKKWLRTNSKSLFILKFKSTMLLSQNSNKIPHLQRRVLVNMRAREDLPWGGKHWRQWSSMEATCCHMWARASTKTRSTRVVMTIGHSELFLPLNSQPSEGITWSQYFNLPLNFQQSEGMAWSQYFYLPLNFQPSEDITVGHSELFTTEF